MKKTLLKTLHLENGRLYAVVDDRRICIAECEPVLEIYEHSTSLPILESHSYEVKKHRITVVLCDNVETKNDIDEKLLRSVIRYSLSADFWREDGIFEVIPFDSLVPIEIDLDGKWMFETDDTELIRKILEM